MKQGFRLTKSRVDRGILTPELEQRYYQLEKTRSIVESIKTKHPDDYIDVVKRMVKDIHNEAPTQSRGGRRGKNKEQTKNVAAR